MMHEFSLYGTVSQADHERTKQQLAGVARMQPQEVTEIHLLFKAKPPSGLANLPSAGGSQGVMQQDVQRIKNMLNTSLYYIQLVGEATKVSVVPASTDQSTTDITMEGTDEAATSRQDKTKWTLEFKDTPDPGKQSVSSRLVSKTPLEGGNLIKFLEQFGYEYASRYFVRGSKFYDQDTTLFLHEIYQLPQAMHDDDTLDKAAIPPFEKLIPVDPGRKFLLQASIDVVDGNQPELKERATKQLLAMKNTLRQAVTLTPGDRLALDTKLPIARRA